MKSLFFVFFCTCVCVCVCVCLYLCVCFFFAVNVWQQKKTVGFFPLTAQQTKEKKIGA